MSPEPSPTPKTGGWVRLLIAFVVAFDVAAFFQWADGAFQSEFGGHPEEAAHYLSGLHVRDAAMHGPAAALRHAPAFDIAQGGWMLIFGSSRIAALLFMAALATATATLVFWTVRREFGDWAAAVASLVWLCAPAVRESYETILPEQFSAFALTGTGLLWARLMDGGNLRRTSVTNWIGVVATLVGGSVLAFAGAVALKVVPGDPSAATLYLEECASALGIATAVFALAGMAIRRRSDARTGATWVAMSALIAGVLLVRWMKAGLPDVRVFIIATPALAMFAARGAVSLAGVVGSQGAVIGGHSRRKALWIFLLLLLALPQDLLHLRQKDWQGFGPVALTLIEQSGSPSRVLVVSDRRGEGLLLAEIAMHDGTRKITIERGSETLADSAATAPDGKPSERFLDDEQLLAHLTSGGIRYIVLDSAVPAEMHAGYHDQVLRVLEDNVRSFWPIYDARIIRDGEPMGHPLRIFRVMKPDDAPAQ